MQQQYLAKWGEGYIKHDSSVVDITFFSEANGYEPEDIVKIAGLKHGDIADLSGISGVHSVERLLSVSVTSLKNWKQYESTGNPDLLDDIQDYNDVPIGGEVVLSGVGWERRLKAII